MKSLFTLLAVSFIFTHSAICAANLLSDNNYAISKGIAKELSSHFPPDKYVILGIGRSPSTILAHLDADQNNSNYTWEMPLSLTNPEGGLSQVAFDQNKELTPEGRKMLWKHFKNYLPTLEELHGRKIVIFDYTVTNNGLGKTSKWINEYLDHEYAHKERLEAFPVGIISEEHMIQSISEPLSKTIKNYILCTRYNDEPFEFKDKDLNEYGKYGQFSLGKDPLQKKAENPKYKELVNEIKTRIQNHTEPTSERSKLLSQGCEFRTKIHESDSLTLSKKQRKIVFELSIESEVRHEPIDFLYHKVRKHLENPTQESEKQIQGIITTRLGKPSNPDFNQALEEWLANTLSGSQNNVLRDALQVAKLIKPNKLQTQEKIAHCLSSRGFADTAKAAADALKAIKPTDPKVLRTLLELLKDQDPVIRNRVLDVLKNIDFPMDQIKDSNKKDQLFKYIQKPCEVPIHDVISTQDFEQILNYFK